MSDLIKKIKKKFKKIYKKLFKKKAPKKEPIKEPVKKKQTEEKPLSKSDLAVLEVMEKTGWTRKEARAKMREVREKYEIRFVNYAKYELYNVPEEELAAKCEEIAYAIKRRKERKQEFENRKALRKLEHKENIEAAMEATGWTKETLMEHVDEAKVRTNCLTSEYCYYRFFDMDNEAQEKIFLVNHSRQIEAKYPYPPEFEKILLDKELTNNYLPELIRRPWCVTNKLTLEKFMDTFKNSSRIFYKPLGGHGGVGAKKYDYSESNAQEIYNDLMTLPTGVVEEFLIQHSKMNELSPSAVNTVRFVTVSSYSQDILKIGNHYDVCYVRLKMGGVNSLVDNLHGGGMVAVVDPETGKLISDAVDGKGNAYSIHPGTGTVIKGFEIPYFAEALKMVKETIESKKLEGYLGWDIAITEKGPELIELNTRPGVILCSISQAVTEKNGIKDHMMRYLETPTE